MSLKQRARDVLDLLERGTYETPSGTVELSDWQAHAVDGTRLYTPEQLAGLRADQETEAASPSIEVVEGITQVHARSLAGQDDVFVLNFASARNPGGGFLNGAKAQEEDLCRCSGLYPTLLTQSRYYQVNRAQDSMIYTDHAIYSPRVPFFKTKGTGELLHEPFRASVCTMPAPNSGPHLRRGGEASQLEQAFERRWANVLCMASDQGHATLLLGAWGCGAFGGDPAMAARTAKSAITRYGDGIRRVVFAIPGRGKKSARNLAVFREVLQG